VMVLATANLLLEGAALAPSGPAEDVFQMFSQPIILSCVARRFL
jgi:hypothetical protein